MKLNIFEMLKFFLTIFLSLRNIYFFCSFLEKHTSETIKLILRRSQQQSNHYSFFKVCLEGEISKDIIMNSLSRGKRASGDMIPWTVSQQFNDHEFGNLSGARVVRIATHPDFQKVNILFLL